MRDLPPIDTENAEINPQIYKKNGKNVYVAFDEFFDQYGSGNSVALNNFMIVKSAYGKNLDSICRYANTFFEYYDKDKEFLTGLLAIKYQIDVKDIKYGMKTFMYDISQYLLTDSVIEKIFKMVDDYYCIDLSPTDEVKDLDLHALQFLNEHGKALMALSIAYKLTIPVVCHYYYVNNEELARKNKTIDDEDGDSGKEFTIKKYLYDIFINYFPLFQGDSELFNKLAVTVNRHLTDTRNSDKPLVYRARNKKFTPTIYADRLIEVVVVDLLPKAIFKKNFISLVQVAIPYQIRQTLLAKDAYDYCIVSETAASDELSSLEKLETNNARISDLNIVIGTVTTVKTIKRIEDKYHVHVSDDEFEYYRTHLKNFRFSNLVLQFFAKDFGGVSDLKTISAKNYIKLLIIFKKIMQRMGYVYIPQIFSGNLPTTVKRRKISTKQLERIENSTSFKNMMKQYSMSVTPDNNPILNTIAAIINTPIEYCDYDNQDKYGTIIVADIDICVDEYIRFIRLI